MYSRVMKLLIFFLIILPFISKAKVVESTLATVGNKTLYLSDLNAYRRNLINFPSKDFPLSEITDRKKLLADKKYLLDYLVSLYAIDAELEKHPIPITPQKINKGVLLQARKKQMSLRQFRDYLKKQGTSLKAFKKSLKNSVTRDQAIKRAISSQISISDEKIFSELEKTVSNPYENEYVLLYIPFQTKAAAEKNLERLASGKVLFRELQKKFKGEVLGVFRQGDLNPVLKEALSKNSSSEILPFPIYMNRTYYVLKVEKKQLKLRKNLEGAYAKVKGELLEQNISVALRRWLSSLKNTYSVQIHTTALSL